jgi:hypothetical protein
VLNNQGKGCIAKALTKVKESWDKAWWRETILLYTAQLSYQPMNHVLSQACTLGGEAAQLAYRCLQEYPNPKKLDPALIRTIQALRYTKLEEYLTNHQWKEADKETYRLMITTVGKEEGQWFEREDLLNFPCEELLAIDTLWVKYSKGRFGFSVQKKIYVECGAKLDGEYPGDEIWEEFGDRVGWRKDGKWLFYDNLEPSLSSSQGIFPYCVVWVGCWLLLEREWMDVTRRMWIALLMGVGWVFIKCQALGGDVTIKLTD